MNLNNIAEANLRKRIIKIVDDIMGSGKTSWAIQYMNDSPNDNKFICITPFLSEVERILKDVTNRKFYTPSIKNEKGSKLEGLKQLLRNGRDIVSTHVLFQSFDEDIKLLIEINGYTLILDEVMSVVNMMDTRRDDIPAMEKLNLITVTSDNRIIWNENMVDYDSQFNGYKALALTNNLFVHSRSRSGTGSQLIVWTFPYSVFDSFAEVYILTYLFKAQLQCYYYQIHNVEMEYYSVGRFNDKYELIPYKSIDLERRQEIKGLINIYEGNMNKVGDKWNALSSTWLKSKKNIDSIVVLKRNTESFFRNVAQTNSKKNGWTTIKGELDGDRKGKVMSLLKGKGYTKGFISCNARATNDYSHKESLAYLLNRFMNPMESGFFRDKGIEVDEETWALSELLQWIWRSRIRNGEPINLFIPSSRMRRLLQKYLEGKI